MFRFAFLLILFPVFLRAQQPVPNFDSLFMRAPAFNERFDTLNLFSYRGVSLTDLPEETHIEVCDSLGLGFCSPAIGVVMSRYGVRGRGVHQGTDVKVALGQPIFAAWDGIVRYSRWNAGGFGNLVIIRHANGLESYYAHLSKRVVHSGQRVEAGEVIGLGGRTGRASALHLHFEVRWFDQSFDSERLIDFRMGALKTHSFALRKEYFNPRSRAENVVWGDTLLMASTAATSAATKEKVIYLEPRILGETESEATEYDSVYHTVRSGDNLWTLARRHGTTVGAICELNAISRNAKLRIGKKLRIK